MAAPRKTSGSSTPRRPPGKTAQARENELVAMAFDHAEKEFRDGTATSQLTTYFLKLGTIREELERDKIRLERELLAARTSQISSSEDDNKLNEEVIRALRGYRGENVEED